jgi:hypothetical protein
MPMEALSASIPSRTSRLLVVTSSSKISKLEKSVRICDENGRATFATSTPYPSALRGPSIATELPVVSQINNLGFVAMRTVVDSVITSCVSGCDRNVRIMYGATISSRR